MLRAFVPLLLPQCETRAWSDRGADWLGEGSQASPCRSSLRHTVARWQERLVVQVRVQMGVQKVQVQWVQVQEMQVQRVQVQEVQVQCVQCAGVVC